LLQGNAEAFEESLVPTASTRFEHDFSGIPIQAPLMNMVQAERTINEPGDKYEQEADRVADAVMRIPESRLRYQEEQAEVLHPGRMETIQSQQEDEDEELVQAKPISAAVPPRIRRRADTEMNAATMQAKARPSDRDAAPSSIFQSQIASLKGRGRPLSLGERSFFEPRFGHDFSGVRIHDGASAGEAAGEIDAEFAPHTTVGRHLLAHELTHVVQQTAPRINVGPALQRKEIAPEVKHDRVLRAADRARRHPDDRVRMLINGSEIVYRLIDLYLPTYRDLVSGVSYDTSVETIRTEATAGGTVSISVGKRFILETNRATLSMRVVELTKELSRWKSKFKVGSGELPLFEARVWKLMDDLMTSSKPGLQLLYQRMLHSSVPITIRSVTDDASTFHVSEARMAPGDRPLARRRRSHTDPSDSKRRGAERDTPTGSIIFVNPYRIIPSDNTYKRGTFVHELVHAFDLANGLYNSDVEIRERRAIFFQNMWRETKGKDPREDYHGRFVTDDYQKAVRADRDGRPNGVATVTAYLLSHNDFP
jgi:hypothetical protein